MGEAFLMDQGGGARKTTFDGMPVVATKTLSNAITARTGVGCAADDEHFVVAGGKDENGNFVDKGAVFDRGGNKWEIPYLKIDKPSLILTNNQLWKFGGINTSNSITAESRRSSLGELVHNTASYELLTALAEVKYAIGLAKIDGDIIAAGGLGYNDVPKRVVERYSPFDKFGREQTYSTHVLQSSMHLSYERAYFGISNITSKAVLLMGGIGLGNTLLKSVEFLSKNMSGSFVRSSRPDLSVAQYSPATAKISNAGYSYVLTGLGKTLPTTQNGMTSSRIVPNIDVYWYDGTSDDQCATSKYESFELPLTGNPTSSIAFQFGNIALFMVGYRGGTIKNKGYLVRVSPMGIEFAEIEFNFSRNDMQGGVIGGDVAYIVDGTKNGQTTGDIEMIQLMRNIPIYPGMKYKLNNMSAEQTANSLTLHPLQTVMKLSGYMKI